jgi:hypothetical protein
MARLELEIEAEEGDGQGGAVHVAGVVRDESGRETAFVGWVGLLSLLQQALSV